MNFIQVNRNAHTVSKDMYKILGKINKSFNNKTFHENIDNISHVSKQITHRKAS